MMTSKIRVLSDHTINKIAAGEVIENPASVVKELVENSLDAGSTEVSIEIRGGGRQLIRITDNGCGMNSDDALLCLERHATSKIRSVEEIQGVMTMGFRGEAIPSIASISKFTLLTRPNNEDKQSSSIGNMVIVDGGKIVSCTQAACAPGTTIEVKSLFFNVPVRMKFLKSPSVDANEILKTISLISLGHPEVKFSLVNDGKNMLTMPPIIETNFDERLKTRIGCVIAQDFLQHSVYVNNQYQGFKVEGFVGNPNHTRHNRSGQYLFINRRAVVSPLIAYAVKDGYGTALAAGRHPTFVLHLSVPEGLVDVNVHPQKREVRLRQEPVIRELISKAIVKSLHQQQNPINRKTVDIRDVNFVDTVNIESFVPKFSLNQKSDSIATSHGNSNPEWFFKPKVSASSWSENQATYLQQDVASEDENDSSVLFSTSEIDKRGSKTEQVSEFLPQFDSKPISPPSVLATIPSSILLEGNSLGSWIRKSELLGGVVFIDQRGAHARILYEKLLKHESGTCLAQQTLLIPHTIQTSSFEANALRAVIPSLNQMGLHIQEFGPQSFLVDAIPQIFGNSNIDMLITDIIRDVCNVRQGGSNELIFQRERSKQIALAASRAAIANHCRLTIEEAQSLINQLVKCHTPFICPLGKSIVAQMTSDEIIKLFQKGI